ncbi:hypothetical protein UCDDS831_g01618 [Diplodia seriata]|uniref:Uncharacterized protein n=1 Tax=Diplodia seriata TaxID=420778 RepID=A0A0G2GS03_9PEZI|nr:hypothetical protein UCDDS831_g01618 [Diplodia seriata]
MPTAATFFSVFAGVLAALTVYVYFFGIPPALKRELEEKALSTMGENKASYLLKDQINKVPASDQKEIKDFKNGVANLAGGTVNNPLGKFAGDAADDATRPFTGR